MESKQAVAALSALAQDHRLAIFRLLVTQGPDGLAAGAIARALGLPAPTLSFHLGLLTRSGLVAQRRAGRSLFYAVDWSGMSGLIGFLTQDCCQGQAVPCLPAAELPCCPTPVEA